jgi:hypothetical protein
MIPRRALPALALLPFAGAARAAPADILFRVVREGAQVGTHRVRFREEAGVLEATSEVRVQVRLMGITVYRYSHDVAEAWRGERLVALSSRLDRNGTAKACEARADASGLTLTGSSGQARLPAEAAPLTWWRAATLRPGVPLFDPREGIAVQPRLETAREGANTRIRLIGGEGAEILYDRAGNWVGFATTGEDGSAVRYERA